MNWVIQKEREVICYFSSCMRNDSKDISSCTYLGGVSNVSF